MTEQTSGMNSDSAKAKREETLARKKAIAETDQKLMVIAEVIPEEWAVASAEKLSLLKSIHLDILGKDKEGNQRPLADLRHFMFLAKQRNLNPFKKQLHAVYIWDSQINGEKLVPITGIDGFAVLAQRTNRYGGLSETRFTMYPENHAEYAGLPESAVVDVFAYNPVTGAREVVTTATVWWAEYAKYTEKWAYNPDTKKKEPTGEKVLNSTWKNRPKGQLEKCAQALGLRRAFPDETGGLYVFQEVDRLRDKPNVIDIEPDQPSTRDTIQEALDKRKAENKNIANGDIPKQAVDESETDKNG